MVPNFFKEKVREHWSQTDSKARFQEKEKRKQAEKGQGITVWFGFENSRILFSMHKVYSDKVYPDKIY